MHQIITEMLNGEKRTENKHNSLIYKTTSELADSYDIFFDGKNIISDDGKMADRIFEAAIELLEKVGVLCIDSRKVIKLSQEEIRASIKNESRPLYMGGGYDTTALVSRKILDNRAPVIMGGPTGVVVSHELYVPIHRSFAKLDEIGAIAPGSYLGPVSTKYAKTPFDMYDAHEAVTDLKKACEVEGRPHLCCAIPPSIRDSSSAISITKSKFMGPGDFHDIFPRPSLQANFKEMEQAIHYRKLGLNYECSNISLMGGTASVYAEQFAIELVAEALKSRLIYSGLINYKYPSHLEVTASMSLGCLWASFMSSVAMSRNNKYFSGSVVNNSAGPCTEMMMYETAVQTMGYTVCGDDIISGPVANGGSVMNHSAGLDALFMAEIAKFSTNLSLGDANFLCLELFDKYIGRVKNPELGKSFIECYDLKDINPSKEYRLIYKQAMNEISDLAGVEIDSKLLDQSR